MTDKIGDRATLKGVINKIREIALRDYDNLVYDNILAIFNMLETEEKRVLLRGLINITFIVEDKILVDAGEMKKLGVAVEGNTVQLKQEVDKIEELNRAELVKMKWFIARGGVVFLLLAGGIGALIAIYLGGSDSLPTGSGIWKSLEFFKVIFGSLD